ncbi:uroporphyrin-III C-methyltransferase/precorrin-2 dehydrogenase/sirohydrochlorin ferrochelatase [Microbacterium sp. W4I4]|uniref:uroporphyrinogen-III C-methyltransferase n=1 Tax=Microbacterium sp. W4I4 TaxID=3042295 RepID=UPI00278B7605|nr:uroporphyrinogen-III C-methyltransferase [Microbacterium sp. W4I4]MDQ0612811.1 uroporphyrin-III C-methyltransferase/precorrin-2 dehydrogenase/sirohydrochlorin ferrochelatase [Microbacterium sp. W4I4]
MTLMLGVSLAGREVLLVGGGLVTARRLRRFVDEGAVVRVVAPQLHPETARLVREHGATWHPCRFRARDLAGAWLVHVATGDAGTDSRVVGLCERRRVICISAGNGEHGSARMTAQLDTGDVTVAVTSTHGADPRRSAAVRDAIDDLIATGSLPLRRRRPARTGRVDLVGGGPGPADLMTVRARRLIAEADVIVTDRLGPAAEVMRGLDADVQVIDVGKRPGHHPVPQEEINRIIVEHATAGRRVVRLKGGDPFVFGRGGEEMQACLEAGVAVDVTPAPSSAIAVPQAAGIPVTHRGVASAFHVVNGQGAMEVSTLAAMADPTVTTVVLMGVAALPRIVSDALRHGVAADRPIAFVESGHTPQQRTTRSTLGRAVADAQQIGLRNPAVIVIGDVARAGLLLPDGPFVRAASA